MNQFINTDDLVEFHKKLDIFAKHHYKRGVDDSLALIKLLQRTKSQSITDGSPEGLAFDNGYEKALNNILNTIGELLE